MTEEFKVFVAGILEVIVLISCIVLWPLSLGRSWNIYEELHGWLWEQGLTCE